LDSDLVLSNDVVEECVVKTRLTGAAGAIVPQISFGKGLWARCKSLEKLSYLGSDLIESVHFVRRDVFLDLGGYDELIAGGGEDWDFPIRLREHGYKVVRVSPFAYHDEGNLKLAATVMKKYYYGKTVPHYLRKYPTIASRQLNPIRIEFIKHRDLFSLDPLSYAAMVAMKMCEFAAGGIGALVGTVSPIDLSRKKDAPSQGTCP